jgi:hypothetical protein
VSSSSVERRIAALEREVAEIKAKVGALSQNGMPWWEKISGIFAGDEAFQKAMKLGRAYRRAQRPSRKGR